MRWFQRVFGFQEEGGFEAVKLNFHVSHDGDGNILLATHGRSFHVGRFDTPTLEELRVKAWTNDQNGTFASTKEKEEFSGMSNKRKLGGGLTFRHTVDDVADLHRQRSGAVFQAASQFNCLEMTSPYITREVGITRYVNDHTQGPVCAMCCPAGTVYRNYFASENLDTLYDVGTVLGNIENTRNNPSSRSIPNYWKMKNGYALASKQGSIRALSRKLEGNDKLQKEAMAQLRVGVHWNTEVCMGTHIGRNMSVNAAEERQMVTQVYCSALPIAYDQTASDGDWELFAKLVLEGSYEATLAVAAILANERKERVPVYLTMLGGGAFGNNPAWIRHAIQRSLELYRSAPLDVFLVHYSRLSPHYSQIKLSGTGVPEAQAEG